MFLPIHQHVTHCCGDVVGTLGTVSVHQTDNVVNTTLSVFVTRRYTGSVMTPVLDVSFICGCVCVCVGYGGSCVSILQGEEVKTCHVGVRVSGQVVVYLS